VSDEDLRQQAVRSLKAKREFRTHLVVYVAVNLFLVAIWAVTGAEFFWPIFPMLGWGIGLAIHAWETYGRGDRVTEEEIQSEMRRLKGSSGTENRP
jgi:uncharacterized membrane protein